MKSNNIIRNLPVFLIIILSLMCCKKGFLDRQPLDRISSTATFSDKNLTEAYLFNLYSRLPTGFTMYTQYDSYGLYMMASMTDEARTKSTWIDDEVTIVPGLISPTNNPMDLWGRTYYSIRIANNIIINLETSPLDETFKKRISSEARFVRAMLYFNLAKDYGDVPLIKVPQAIEDTSGMMVSRTPLKDVYDFIDTELESIGEILPSAAGLPISEYGRATREAAWALDGRVLLYAKDYAKSATYSKKVMDANVFHLDPDYNALFQSHGGSPEAIFEVLFNGAEKGHDFDRYNVAIPWYIDYASQTDPTQEMVDAYEMTNGLPITDPASTFNPNDPYKNRDSRLLASIYYQGGATYKGHDFDMVLPNGEQATLRTGLSSISGYYIRKFMDDALDAPVTGKSKTSWKELRLGEVLLNYAEAQNESAGPDASVSGAVNTVRARANMPDLAGGLSKDDMREHIIHERRIELAFEDFRWYDLIRWRRSEAVLNNKFFHGMKVTRSNTGSLIYDPTFALDFHALQVFQAKNYLLPIPQYEMVKNHNLTQNPGY